jgi:hypothetical protein
MEYKRATHILYGDGPGWLAEEVGPGMVMRKG